MRHTEKGEVVTANRQVRQLGEDVINVELVNTLYR